MKTTIRKIAVTGIMGALSFVLMLLEFPLPFLIPSFIKFDFSDIPALIVSFALGPGYGVLVCLIKNLIHLPFSQTSGVGELANFLLGAMFALCAGLVYKYNNSRNGAIFASLAGALAMAVISLPINYFITYPFYFNFLPKDVIVGMYSAINPNADNLFKALLYFNVPFTFMKGLIDSLICIVIYKKISPVLKPKL